MRSFSSEISERSLVFKPGFEVDGEIVGRTFQPAYVVARDGVLITFCQGRLWGGSDDEGRTWCHKVVEAASFFYSTVGPLKESRYITLFARNSMGQDGVGGRVFEDDWLSGQD